jgi:hypothetical protein
MGLVVGVVIGVMGSFLCYPWALLPRQFSH